MGGVTAEGVPTKGQTNTNSGGYTNIHIKGRG